MIVVVCPGQGSQTPGFLSPWLELDGARERLSAFSDAAGVDLVAHGTESDADTIRDTRVAQPLIVAASLLAWEQLTSAGARPEGVAGHSVGEIAALVAAGVIDAEAGLRLVGVRGRAMADAAALVETGMSAVVGGDEGQVLQAIADNGLTPANYNGGGQIVAAGELPGLAALAEQAPRGTRVVPLQVAGAFHTRFMAPAQDALRTAVEGIDSVDDPSLTLWSNSDGSAVDDGRRALDLIVHQVASPVRWDLCMASFADRDITGLIELAPAGALTGLAKRGLRGVPSVAVKTPDDLAAARELLAS
ncbi:ACP S-malonyltransferase [Microbacterium marinilacus]|uniref:[acyl-carrier-protein] S-malonyltransferase n=1 Tax=Microbacterium marinilacus TaxID=415209 RepID=A0ABP7B1H0_9MICO|nr:ACP S-malonyltransferase [Microbacterium marinilacus]MBY0688652.1 ACP S-malonyltransferase [Microbacterium marinilacus]